MHAVKTRIIRWLILWILNDWVSICALSWSLYVCIINLDFLYLFDMSECLISFTNPKLKIRTSRRTASMMINSNTRFFSKSFISFRLEFIKIKVRVEMRAFSNWFECEFLSWRKTMISATFWYFNNRRLIRVDLIAKNSDDKLFRQSND